MTEWVAYTPIEGTWAFTRSVSPYDAVQKLLDAISRQRVLVAPVTENKISAVLFDESRQ